MADTVTLSQAQETLALYRTAEQKILRGQSYTIGDRNLTRADLRWVQSGIKQYQGIVQKLTSGGIRVTRAVPMDF